MQKEFKLGEKLKDIVSGFTGIATARTEYLNGCIRYTIVQAQSKEHPELSSIEVDVEQLKKVGNGIARRKKVTNTGGPKGYGLKKITRESTY